MIETEQDNKQKRQQEFKESVELTEEDLRKLINEKFARARIYSEAWQKREDLLLEDH